MSASSVPDRGEGSQAPFLVGVSGHMKLAEEKKGELRDRFRVFFHWLRMSPEKSVPGLGAGLGLQKTPIHLLTSLAPGVDQIAAEVAEEFGIQVIAPIPFPLESDQYLRSSTFQSATLEEKEVVRNYRDRTFYVELAAERVMDSVPAHLKREVSLRGDALKKWRYAHLRASGEYVAAYADVLLAVTDLSGEKATMAQAAAAAEPSSFDPEHKYSCGTPAIVQVRRRGLTPGLLPVEPPLPWAEVGPVVYLPWPKGGEPGEVLNEGSFTFWVESDPRPAEVEAEREVIQEIAELVEDFNTRAAKIQRGGDNPSEVEMRAMFDLSSDLSDSGDAEPEMPDQLRKNLLGIAGARRFAKAYNYDRTDAVEDLRSGLLNIVVGVTILWSIHGNWESVVSAPPSLNPILCLLYLLATGWGLWGLYLLIRFRLRRVESDQIDTRCVAEGLRVQFYWTAAGTGESVASNYLLRQRGSIRWITNTVSAASSPYEQVRDAFRGMTLRERYNLLGRVVRGWITSRTPSRKGQILYFEDACEKLRYERVRCQWQGWAFLFAGFWVSLFLFVAQVPELFAAENVGFGGLRFGPTAGLGLFSVGLVLTLLVGISVFLIGRLDSGNPKSGPVRNTIRCLLYGAGKLISEEDSSPENSNDPNERPGKRKKEQVPVLENELRDWFFSGWKDPDETSVVAEWLGEKWELRPTVVRERMRSIFVIATSLGFSLVLTLALVVLAAGVAMVGWAAAPSGVLPEEGWLRWAVMWSPSPESLLLIAKTVLFALSGRAFLTSTLRFHTENLRNYEAMLDLFRSGQTQLDRHLRKLDARCSALDEDACFDPVAEQTIADAQTLIFALGREALSEHAEWLQLRRDRPVSADLPNP